MKKKGFTLIELLVVIAIIGLLSTLAVIALNNAREKSRDAKRVADIKQVQTALEMYFNAKNAYPNGTNCGTYGTGTATVKVSSLGSAPATATCSTGLSTDYFGGITNLHDPKATAAGALTCQHIAVAGGFCDYGYQGANNNYALYFRLEGTTGSELVSGIHTATESGIQ